MDICAHCGRTHAYRYALAPLRRALALAYWYSYPRSRILDRLHIIGGLGQGR